MAESIPNLVQKVSVAKYLLVNGVLSCCDVSCVFCQCILPIVVLRLFAEEFSFISDV